MKRPGGVSNDSATFHVTCSHMLLCVSTRKSSRSTIKIACLVSWTPNSVTGDWHTETYIGLGRMSNISVSALGPDSRLCQHIYDVNSWYSCLLVLFYTLFPYIYLSLTDGPNFTPFQNVEFVNKSKPFFQTNSREEKNTKFQHNLTPERQFCWIYSVFHFVKTRMETLYK